MHLLPGLLQHMPVLLFAGAEDLICVSCSLLRGVGVGAVRAEEALSPVGTRVPHVLTARNTRRTTSASSA